MSQSMSNNGGRGLLPTRSNGKEKDREGDDRLLRPTTRRDSPRARWGSNSTGQLSRKSSQAEEIELAGMSRLRRKSTATMADLQRERELRRQGEEYLRSALFSISTFATEITRRLDYTYYNLLEKVTTLHGVIDSFKELSESTALLGKDFEKETTNLDQDTRRQLEEFKSFKTQIRDIEALEKRMNAGREKVDALGQRLTVVKKQIEEWERKELEWQAQTSRRLRIFWVVIGTAILVLVIAVVIQTRSYEGLSRLTNGSTNASLKRLVPEGDVHQLRLEDDIGRRRPSSLSHSSYSSTSTSSSLTLKPTGGADSSQSCPEHNPFQILDEL